jgi:hypothetical protein
MNQSAYIYASIKARWLAHATLPGYVPGGLGAGFVSSPTARPFASIIVRPEGEPEYQTGLLYVQGYGVSINVWSNELVGNAGVIQSALGNLLTARTKLTALVNGAWTLHCSLEPAGIDEQVERLFGKYVFVAGARWLIQLQESRV